MAVNVLRIYKMKRRKANRNFYSLLRNFLREHVIERRVEGNVGGTGDVSRYWMTCRKLEDTGC